MTKSSIILVASAFIFCCGFFTKNEDGSLSIDKAAIESKITEVAEQNPTISTNMIAQIKAAAQKCTITDADLLADLKKNGAELKEKITSLDPATVVAYIGKYKEELADSNSKISQYTAEFKSLKWTEKLGTKGTTLKNSITEQTTRLKGLKETATLYLDKLESFGVSPASFGFDLSSMGL